MQQQVLQPRSSNARSRAGTKAERHTVYAARPSCADSEPPDHHGFAITSLPHKRLTRRSAPRRTPNDVLVELGSDRRGNPIGVPYGSIARRCCTDQRAGAVEVCTQINPLLQLGFRRRAVEIVAIQMCEANQRAQNVGVRHRPQGRLGRRRLCYRIQTRKLGYFAYNLMPRAPAQHKSHRSSPRNRHPEALDRIGEREQLTRKTNPRSPLTTLRSHSSIYLLLHNKKIRTLSTLSARSVLILGRFVPERKRSVQAADTLHKRDLLPVIFDFSIPSKSSTLQRPFSAGRPARFVIATSPMRQESRWSFTPSSEISPSLPVHRSCCAG